MVGWIFCSILVFSVQQWPCAKHAVHTSSCWRWWTSVLWSNYMCHSSNFGLCCILDNIVFSSSTGHLPGSNLTPSPPKEQSLSSQCDYSPFHSIIGFFYYSLKHSNQILLSTKIFVLQIMLASSAVKKIAVLLNTVSVNRTPLYFYFESKHLSKFICSVGKAGVS